MIRRNFIKYLSALACAGSIRAIEGNLHFERYPHSFFTSSSTNHEDYLVYINLMDRKIEYHKSPVLIHEMLWSPMKPDLIVTVPLWGIGDRGRVGIFSISKKKFIHLIPQGDPFIQFSGHGDFDFNGKDVWIGMNQYNYKDLSNDPKRDSGKGFVAKINVESGEGITELFPSGGIEPQQIITLADDYIAVLHSGNNRGKIVADSLLNFIQPSGPKVLEKILVGKKGHEGYGHMVQLKNGELILTGGVSHKYLEVMYDFDFDSKLLKISNKKLSTYYLSKDLKGGTFNIYAYLNEIAFNFHKNVSFVMKSNVTTKTFKRYPLESNLGSVVMNKDVTIFGANEKILIINNSDNKMSSININKKFGRLGPHSLLV